MRMSFFLAALVALFMFTGPAQAEIVTRNVSYAHDGKTLEGYLVYDDALEGRLPGVVVVHEWWGLNEYARTRAYMLAKLGYVSFAADMYGAGITGDTPDAAKKLSAPFYADPALMRGRVDAALDALKTQTNVDRKKLAVIGFCFGGTAALESARSGADIAAAVSFHGGLSTKAPAQPNTVKARVLTLDGAADEMVSAAERENFATEMKQAGVNVESVNYPNAKHAFTNPAADDVAEKFGLPVGYDADADAQSWDKMKAFLAQTFAAQK